MRRWHLRDALLAYEHLLRERARRDYDVAMLVFTNLAPFVKKNSIKPPRPPRILQE